MKLIDLDPTVTKNFITRSANCSKLSIANLYTVLHSQRQTSVQKTKQSSDEVIQALYVRLSEIKAATSPLVAELQQPLNPTEAEQFVSHPKVRKFVTGIRVLSAISDLQIKNIQCAVDREDDKYSMDFEAMLRELT